MGIDLARRRFGSLAKYAVMRKDLQISIVKHIAKAIKMEIKSLCSTSILFDGQKENVCALSWNKLHNELETRTPQCLVHIIEVLHPSKYYQWIPYDT